MFSRIKEPSQLTEELKITVEYEMAVAIGEVCKCFWNIHEETLKFPCCTEKAGRSGQGEEHKQSKDTDVWQSHWGNETLNRTIGNWDL